MSENTTPLEYIASHFMELIFVILYGNCYVKEDERYCYGCEACFCDCDKEEEPDV